MQMADWPLRICLSDKTITDKMLKSETKRHPPVLSNEANEEVPNPAVPQMAT